MGRTEKYVLKTDTLLNSEEIQRPHLLSISTAARHFFLPRVVLFNSECTLKSNRCYLKIPMSETLNRPVTADSQRLEYSQQYL